MHGLGGTDVLRFARCSRRLLRASDSPFAWLHTRVGLVYRIQAVSERIHERRSGVLELMQRAYSALWSMLLRSARPPLPSIRAAPHHPLRHAKMVLRLEWACESAV